MKLAIVVPFRDAERQTESWASEEAAIDFHREFDRAARCTTAFAAIELKRFFPNQEVCYAAQRPATGAFVELHIARPADKDTSFTIEPVGGGVRVTGKGRAGVLYGAYELLRQQGWRWYAPGKGGEIAPPTRELQLPRERLEQTRWTTLGCGFDFAYPLMESAELFLWMARNRLNLAAPRPNTTKLCQKLGMELKVGGHIFEKLLAPDRVLSSGKTMWDEHRNWYGLPSTGERSPATALQTQFCVSQPDLLEFLGAEILRRLNDEWSQADRVDVWGFDTWGNACACPACRSIGTGTDQLLFALSAFRAILDKARLNRPVRLVFACYEGTGTITPGHRPCPQNLIDAGDYAVFYPINRCYAHDFTDATCPLNARYHVALQSWLNVKPALPIMLGEYYNVSKFEDLPVLFTQRIARDFPACAREGVQGLTYMHVPMVNWAVRTITQLQYAELGWDAHADSRSLLDRYFTDRYGLHAAEMKRVYAQIETAWAHCSSWRSWSPDSILSRLLQWNAAPLTGDAHFPDAMTALTSGRDSVAILDDALQSVERIRGGHPRLAEDWRLIRYGRDMMRLMTELVAYHEGESRWQVVEEAAAAMESYEVPISYEEPGPGLVSRDALTRSQLRTVLVRCREQRGISS